MKGRFKSFDFWDGAVFGATIATLLGLALAYLFAEYARETWGIIARLIVIPVAGVGALIALWSTRYQITHAREQDLEAARAVLPLALSRAISVAKKGMAYASGQLSGSRTEIEDALALDESVIQVLRDCVRSSDPLTREWLQVLIGRYQVYFARLDGWSDEPSPVIVAGKLDLSNDRQDAIMDWATFHAIVEHFFSYARGLDKAVPRRLREGRISSPYFMYLHDLAFDDGFRERIDVRTSRLEDGRIEHFQFKD